MATRTEAIGSAVTNAVTNAVTESIWHFQRWQDRHRLADLQARARKLSVGTRGRHGVAELIAGGHWSTLDWLLDELDRGEGRLE